MSNVNAAPSFANLEIDDQVGGKGNGFFEHAPSAEDSFADKEFASELLSQAKKRCSPKHYDIFCSIVFQTEKYKELAQKYGCSISRIRQCYTRARRIFCLVALDLIHNRTIEPTKREQPGKAERAPYKAQTDKAENVSSNVRSDIKNDAHRSSLASEKDKKQTTKIPEWHEDVFQSKTEEFKKPTVCVAQNQQGRESPGKTNSTTKVSEDTEYGCAPGCLGLLFVLLLFAGGCWYLYDAITPNPKGVSFERVIIESGAGDKFPGELQSDLQIDSGKRLHQVSLSSVSILRIRPEPGTRQRLRSKDDRLSVCIETVAGNHLAGIMSRWVAFKRDESYKYMDLLKVKEIRSDSICGHDSCHETFSVLLEKLPPL